MSSRKDMVGERHGRLTVVREAGSNKHGKVCWTCRCDCRSECVAVAGDLRSGNTRSCGCLSRETTAIQGRRNVIHGRSNTAEHRVWSGMINRCTNSNDPIFKRYGGRGIEVCPEWLNSFSRFLTDMGPRPTGGTVERLDNNGPYAPWNCCWATRKQQARNRRSTRLLTYSGESRPLAEWAELQGMKTCTLWRRLSRSGWSVERALLTPVEQRSYRPMAQPCQ